MTHPHYYASTSRIITDPIGKYGLYCLVNQTASYIWHDSKIATFWARAICTAASFGITTAFLGLESNLIDSSVRDAMSAEMGIDSKDIKFTDYKYSKNTIIEKAYTDLMRLQFPRYATDALFMLPEVVDRVFGTADTRTNDVKAALDSRSKEFEKNLMNPNHPDYNPNHTPLRGAEILFKSGPGLDMSPYAGKGAYWLGETFLIDKTAYYEVVKLRENIEATGKNMRPDDLMAVYQRTRNDKNLPMLPLNAKQEYDTLMPLFKRMADAYNQHDGKFSIPEIVYMIGLGKINIHASDNKTVSQAAAEQSGRELDHLLEVGLSGIREENRAMNQSLGRVHNAPGWVDRVKDSITNPIINGLGAGLSWLNMAHKRPEESISRRDPSELVNVSPLSIGRG